MLHNRGTNNEQMEGKKMLPEAVLRRLVREASRHLGDPQSKKSLRDLCRRFLGQHRVAPKQWGGRDD